MQDIYQAGLPTRAVLGPTGLHLELRDVEPAQLHDPFLQQTVTRVPAQHVRIEVPKDDLKKTSSTAAPAGLIFHVARCGSTLASQLLKHHEQVVVYSEPLTFNEILVPPHKWNRAELVEALRALGAFFARHACKPYVLKLSSWNTLYCDLVAEAFPATPWALCIRDPLEVCVSLLDRPPGWMRDSASAPHLFSRIVDPTQTCRTREDYCARVYAAFCEAVGLLDVKHGKLIHYEALPDAVWGDLGPHFGLSFDERLRQSMSEASRTYSKSRAGQTTEFVPDDAKKRAAASSELRRSVEAVARPALERLLSTFRGESRQ
jgi:hypothetical protein